MVKIVLRLTDRDLPVVFDEQRSRPEASEVQRLICDNHLAKEILDWQPLYSLEHGLAKVIEFVEAHSDQYQGAAYVI